MSVMMFTALRDDTIPVSGGPGTVTASDVITRIRLNSGSLTIADTGEYADVIRANPALFATRQVGPGLMLVVEGAGQGPTGLAAYPNLVTYGLIGLIAIVALSAIRNR